MLLVMVAIGLTDVLFALDSIPAIFGLTQDAFIVFTANAFSLLGLRQLYFLIAGLLERLIYLGQGLAVILAFIGVKLVFHAMHVNELPFINGGEHIEWAPEIPIWFSLGFIMLTIAVATVASLVVSKKRQERGLTPTGSQPTVSANATLTLTRSSAPHSRDAPVASRRPRTRRRLECPGASRASGGVSRARGRLARPGALRDGFGRLDRAALHTLPDDGGDAVLSHRHPVQRVGDLHRALLVRDDDEL